jgi:hypothetical protein
MVDSIDDVINGIDRLQNLLESPLTAQEINQKNDGFVPSADGEGLPSSKILNNRDANIKRNIISWFVPEFGIVKMFINPQSLTIQDSKSINQIRTKGGYTLQYWGENLTQITLNGTTGSSGIEGINVLYEIYRAEQYAFDAVGLQLAANNSNNNGAINLANKGIDAIGGLIGDGILGDLSSNLLKGITGQESIINSLAVKNIPSLAQLAFTVEMFYNGWVYRGYFESFTLNERADNFHLQYDLKFIATQRRGYRTNYLPWHKSPFGPSQYSTPNSFSGHIKGT